MVITNKDIYNNALVHIGESANGEFTSDYEERAPYLIASFCSLAKSVDKLIRSTESLGNQPGFSPVFIALDSDFPLSDPLCPAAAYYVAAMLVIDEDPKLSDTLYDKYCDSMAALAAEYEPVIEPEIEPDIDPEPEPEPVAWSCESIVDRYYFD